MSNETGGTGERRRLLAAWTAMDGYKHYPELANFYMVNDEKVEIAVRGPEGALGCTEYVAMTMPCAEFIKMLRVTWAALGFPDIGASAQELLETLEEVAAMSKCHICGRPTRLACSDCRIDFAKSIYVCESEECRDKHDMKCSAVLRVQVAELREALEGLLAITDRQHAAWDKARFAIARASKPESR